MVLVLIFYTGAFGKVYSGSMESDGTETVVAIKTVKSMNKLITYMLSIIDYIFSNMILHNVLSKSSILLIVCYSV